MPRFARAPAPEPDDFAPAMTPYELRPRDEDPNRSPIIVRERIDFFSFRLGDDNLPVPTEHRGYECEFPESGPGRIASLWCFGPPDAPEYIGCVLSESQDGKMVGMAVDALIADVFAKSGGRTTHYRLIRAEERAIVLAAFATIPLDRRGSAWSAGEETRERLTPDGLLRLHIAEQSDDADVHRIMHQIIGDQRVVVPISEWSDLDPFRHQLTPEEEAARDLPFTLGDDPLGVPAAPTGPTTP
jgi:hypothetical protein